MSINVYDCHINTYCITHYESKCIKLLLKALQWLLNSLWVKINVLRRTPIPSLGRPLWSLHHSLLIHVVLATLIPLILLAFQASYLFFSLLVKLFLPHISTWMTFSLPVGLYSEVTFSTRPLLDPWINISMHPTLSITSSCLMYFSHTYPYLMWYV